MFSEEKYREELCKIMQRLYERNLISSIGGNASIILRKKNLVLITPTGLDKLELKPQDIVKVDSAGKVIGKGKPSTEIINHLEMYKLRSDINAIIHAHPPFSTGIITSGYTPKAVTPEQVLLSNDIAVVDFIVPRKDSIIALTKALEKSNVVMVKNHGSFSVGKSLIECFTRIEVLEEASKMLIAGKLFGGMPELSNNKVENIIKNYSKT